MFEKLIDFLGGNNQQIHQKKTTKLIPKCTASNLLTGSCIKSKKNNLKPKECPTGKVLNPKSGRCVKDRRTITTNTKPKECPTGKVLNPKSGRCSV